MIRTFIAIALPDDIKASIDTAVAALRERNRAVRWVKPEGLHITLKFLGEIPEDIVAPLSADLDRVGGTSRPLQLSLASFGAFRSIDRACAKYGIAEERSPFSGHITLGRLKTPTVVDLGIGSVSGMFMASEVLLYRSVLSPGGAQYTVLHRSSLGS
jgi:2'-5' RNA ligase